MSDDLPTRNVLGAQPAQPGIAFDAARAESYDGMFEPIRAITNALHLLLRMHFSRLPEDARVLIVGAGTGAEVRFLAPIFPTWRFTLVDPSEAMLNVARRHATAEGFADRCEFHVGLLSSLSLTWHDGATSLLVSHFLTDAGERQAFFEDIAARLKPGGLLFNADMAADPRDPAFDTLLGLWMDLLTHAGTLAPDARAAYRAAFGTKVSAQAPAEVEALIARAGFTAPAACYQAALMRGWAATRLPG